MQYQRKRQILKSKNNTSSDNLRGNYILGRWNGNGSNVALIPETPRQLFDVQRDNTNVLVYIDQKDINKSNLRMFLALTLAKDPDFNVAITTNQDSGIAENADVIVNLFRTLDDGFSYGLETYNDGSRYFVSLKELSKIKSISDFNDFIKTLKQNFIISQIGGMR